MAGSTELMFRTPVEFPPLTRRMTKGDGSVFLGSCFAANIGERMRSYALPVLCNPTGVLYNPASILAVVRAALDADGSALPLFQQDGEWRCWLAGSVIGGQTREECEASMREALRALRDALQGARFLVLTLGTNVCYRLADSGLTVANCHKVPARAFREETLSADECARVLNEVVEVVTACNPDIQVLLTVSPYRYRKYTLHGSQLSKATLLLATDEVCRSRAAVCTYLPVYEIFMDELRDYRFYAADMLHPSEVAVDYVWQRFVEAVMDDPLQAALRDYEPVRKAMMHRKRE